MTVDLKANLELNACPHCSVAKPLLSQQHQLDTRDHSGLIVRYWRIYKCSHCGGLVTAWSLQYDNQVMQHFPMAQEAQEDLPTRAKAYLQQAINSLHVPSGAVMLSASAVDAMLKDKGYKKGSLYERIGNAADDNIITLDMAKWAHDVRLDANDERHADDDAKMPEEADAKRCVDFAKALGQFMYVLPARISRGRSEAAAEDTD